MNVGVFNIGQRSTGDRVVVRLEGNAADVFLVDDNNLSSFRSGRAFQYSGGHFTASPVTLAVPNSGSWHVVVDPGRGRVRASVRVLAR